MYFVRRQADTGDQVYLDMTALPEETWRNKLSDLRQELMHYLALDPKAAPIPVQEGIHYFMGGILTDEEHRTNLRDLYAAGECTCQYHGANRLGGNSMLGALYGGRRAAQTVLQGEIPDAAESPFTGEEPLSTPAAPALIRQISEILLGAMGIVRKEAALKQALSRLDALHAEYLRGEYRILLARAMLLSALERRESRGAHYREDFPEKDEALRKPIAAAVQDGTISLEFRPLPERRSHAGNT